MYEASVMRSGASRFVERLRDVGERIDGWIIVLIGILLLALYLRIPTLGQTFIEGEINNVKIASQPVALISVGLVRKNIHPPLYFVLLHYWQLVFGESEQIIRLLSVVAGLAAVYLIYRVGWRLFDRKTGVVAALLLATAPFHIDRSQSAMPRAVLSVFILLSMYTFLRFQSSWTRRDEVGYILSTAAMMYALNTAFLVAVAQNIYMAYRLLVSARGREWGRFRRWMRSQFVVALLYLPWVPFLLLQTLKVTQRPHTPVGLRTVLVNGIMQGQVAAAGAALLCVGIGIVGIVTRDREREDAGYGLLQGVHVNKEHARSVALLLLWGVAAIGIPFFLTQAGIINVLYNPRHSMAAGIALVLMMAWGIRRIPFRAGSVLFAALLAGMMIQAPHLYTDTSDWRKATRFIDTHAEKRDVIIFNDYQRGHNAYTYYSERDLDITALRPDNLTRITDIAANRSGIWLVYHRDHDPHRLILKALRARYDRVFAEGAGPDSRFDGMEVYRFTTPVQRHSSLSRNSH